MPAVLGTKLKRVAQFFGIGDLELAYWLGQVIVPVFDLAPFVKEVKAYQANGNLTGAAGSYVAYTSVPLAKRWTLRAAARGAVALGTSALMVAPQGLTPYACAAPDVGAGAQGFAGINGLSLPPLAGIGLAATANVGDGAISLSLIYDEEDA